LKVVFDTDVVLDVLLDRKPYVQASAQLLSLVELAEIAGCIASTSITTIYYLTRKSLGAAKTRRAVEDLLGLLEVAPVNRIVLTQAVASRFSDFEDAVVAHAALEVQADVIATRNARDFKHSPIPAQSPADILAAIVAGQSED
jgi:predicted nucleic acid-binding protein